MTAGGPRSGDDRPRWYGRRRGHRLRKGRQELLRDLLPRLRVAPPESGGRLDLAAVFHRSVTDVWLEVGFGAGEHLAAQARAHPHVGIIGCEAYINGVAGLLAHVREGNLTNVRIFDDDARLLFDALPDAGIGRAFVLFSDPWPKKKHHKNRVVRDEFLGEAWRVLAPADDAHPPGEVRIVTDHEDYWTWMQEHFARWTSDGGERTPPPFALREFVAPQSAGEGELVGTNFERKFRVEGRSFHSCVLVRQG